VLELLFPMFFPIFYVLELSIFSWLLLPVPWMAWKHSSPKWPYYMSNGALNPTHSLVIWRYEHIFYRHAARGRSSHPTGLILEWLHALNKNVCNRRLNCSRLWHCLRSIGGEFHSRKPAAAKHRSPKMLDVRRVTQVAVSADRSRRALTSATSWQSSVGLENQDGDLEVDTSSYW